MIHPTALVSNNTRIRRELEVGKHSIIDDFCYISCRLILNSWSHIGANCTFIGGDGVVIIGKFVNIAPGCRMICASHDYAEGGLAGPTIPEEYQGQSTTKAIWISRHVLLGCNTVVLPGIHLPEGMATGAMTLVTNQRYEPWTLYVGIPARPLRSRNKDKILEQANRLLADYS